MQHSGGFVASRPLPLPGSLADGQPEHATVVVRCDQCGVALLLFEQVSRTLLTMRSYGAELRSPHEAGEAASAQCQKCGHETRFDPRLLPHVG